jgi:uncharacterized protein (DUF3084 family)
MIPVMTGEADTLLSLLKMLADPKQMEATFKKLSALKKEADDAIAEAHKQSSDAASTMNKIGQAQADLIRREKAVTDEREQLTAIRNSLQQQKDELAKRAAALGEQISNAGRLEADVQSRNAQSVAREARVAKREEELKKSVDEHRAWLESIKPPR